MGLALPSVSVLTTCRKPEDADKLKELLRRQTFKDFEIVVTHDPTIPDGWNSAMDKAKGDILVFVETDCVPTDNWLEQLIGEVEDNRLVRGLEVVPTALHMNNVAITRTTLGDLKLDRSFWPSDDGEFFIRLFDNGVSLKEAVNAMVFHYREVRLRRRLGRAFSYGQKWSRIYHRYGALYDSWYHAVGSSVLRIVEDLLLFLGTTYGLIRYLPERLARHAGERSSSLQQKFVFTDSGLARRM
jgi:glycosyltransferase involved in cell wall biosynthesis